MIYNHHYLFKIYKMEIAVIAISFQAKYNNVPLFIILIIILYFHPRLFFTRGFLISFLNYF